MFLYSHTITPRLQYTVHFLSYYYLTKIYITTDATEFKNARGVKINYSDETFLEDAVWMQPAGLLFGYGIKEIAPQCFSHEEGYTAFFSSGGAMRFDLFSAIFYLLSRYEEYLPHTLDSYGRYAHHNSIAFKNDFLHLPLINIWLQNFSALLQRAFNCQLPTQRFSFLPTYDIDMAWSYKHKGFLRNAGGIARSFLQGNFSALKQRISVITRTIPDPYDAFEWMEEMHLKYEIEPTYFFHAGQKKNRYDKNIATSIKTFRALINSIAKKYKLGLHPSWHSGHAHEYVHIEKAVLEEIVGKPITASRQHYIRFTMPNTFRNLLHAGINEDYSMGYATINGFRASVALPFYWYDLEKEEQTDLLIHPFCFMDANSYFELHQSSKDALKEMMQYYTEVKKVNGTLCTIWHNTFLGTDPIFAGWKEVYESFIQKVAAEKTN